MYFFFVFFGYFKKRCYFCNRLAEMASKAMAKSCCVIRLIQVRVLQILREFRTYLFPVLVSLALDPYLGILCPIVLKKKNSRHGMDGKHIKMPKVLTILR